MSEAGKQRESDTRAPDGRFANGRRGGRPKGVPNKTTRYVRALLDEHAKDLTQTAIDAALAGDMIALRVCMERLVPAPKDAPITFDFPPMRTPADAVRAAGMVLSAVACGELTPIEGTRVMALVDSFRRTLELTEIDQRLRALEAGREP